MFVAYGAVAHTSRHIVVMLDLSVDRRHAEAELADVLGPEFPRLDLDDDVSAELEIAGYLALAPPAWGVT